MVNDTLAKCQWQLKETTHSIIKWWELYKCLQDKSFSVQHYKITYKWYNHCIFLQLYELFETGKVIYKTVGVWDQENRMNLELNAAMAILFYQFLKS